MSAPECKADEIGKKADADYVRFSPKSGRIDTVTVESARDPKRTFSRICGSAGGCRKPVYFVPAVVRPDARIVIEQWRQHYNTRRPHFALGYPFDKSAQARG